MAKMFDVPDPERSASALFKVQSLLKAAGTALDAVPSGAVKDAAGSLQRAISSALTLQVRMANRVALRYAAARPALRSAANTIAGQTQLAPGSVAADRSAAASSELDKMSRKLLGDLVTDKDADGIAAKAKAAADAGQALDDAIERVAASTRFPLALRGPGAGNVQVVADLMRAQELRETLRVRDPSEVERAWKDVQTGGDDGQRMLFASVALPLMRDVVRQGEAALKLRHGPRTTAGWASKELGIAHRLARELDDAQQQSEPEWLDGARQARDLLGRAFKLAVGLDQTWLSKADFSRLYLSAAGPSNDPDLAPYRLAPPRSMIGRFLSAKLVPSGGKP